MQWQQQIPYNDGQYDDMDPMPNGQWPNDKDPMPNGQWLTFIQAPPAPPDADVFFNNGNGITIKNTFVEIGCSDQTARPLHKVATAGGRLELLAEETPRGVACF
jgi:hypothetical protein